MFYNNVTVNGVTLKVAFVRLLENAISVTGMTDSGHVMEVEFSFADNMRLVAEYKANEAPVKKERKARKPKAQPEVAEVATPAVEVESVEVPTDEEYLTLTQNRGRGRPSKDVAAKIAAYKAAHGE